MDAAHIPGERPARRAPAVVAVVCFAGGILVDRWLAFSLGGWLLAIAACGCGSFAIRKWNTAAGVLLVLACCVAVGGARHHAHSSAARPDEVSLFATLEPRLVQITGTIATSPEIAIRHQSDAWSAYPQVDRSSFSLSCHSLEDQAGNIPLTGRARVQVAGRLTHVQVGDVVDVHGWLELAGGPANPGEFEFREYLLQRGQRCVVRTVSPDAVSRVGRDHWFSFRRVLSQIRAQSEEQIVQQISEPNVPLAKALLLGDRTEMPGRLRDAFATSGTTHFLAISGLHVGILAAFIWAVCRLLNFSPVSTTRICLLVVFAYALLIDLRPPVVRALVMLSAMSLGTSSYRPGNAANNLAIAALVVLLWNPTDLFNVGAQLSFLAVIGILVGVGVQRHIDAVRPRSGIEALTPESRSPAWLLNGWNWLKRGYLLTGFIWILTAPLVAARFHLVSPVGLLINVLLMPLVSLIMVSGFLFLLWMWLLPPMAFIFAFAFDRGLSLLQWLVELGAQLQFGHFYVAGPGEWWLVGLYGSFALLLLLSRHRMRTWVGLSLCVWVVAGMFIGLMPARQPGLQFSVLSTGHGCATVVRFPNGRSLIYDAGNLQDGRRAERAVRQALWDDGLTRIDALIVSHADMDHFNGVPGLLRTLPVGNLMLSQPFLHFDQQGVEALCDTAADYSVPIRLLARGDRIRIDESAVVEVLHPTWKTAAAEDNIDSMVLLIEYAGRTIMLPGDLEGAGLDQLLSLPPRKIDVLLAPHHGSLGSNTRQLAQWAQPECVFVSTGGNSHTEALHPVYGHQTQVLATNTAGAIICRIDPQGEIDVSTFLGGSSEH